MDATIQILGAVLILVPFAWSQLGDLAPESRSYLLLNFCGSGMLALVAVRTQQWGFLLLEGSWAGVSLGALVRRRQADRGVRTGAG